MRPVLCVILTAVFTGCSLAPKYVRQAPPVPPAHRDTPAATAEPTLGALSWEDVIQDRQLHSLIRQAVDQNYDVRIAAARVLEARAALGITAADQLPTIEAAGQYTNLRISENGTNPLPPGFRPERDVSRFVGLLNWELDFWGRLRNATAAARAQMLAAEETQALVRQTLVAELCRAYFELLDIDVEIDLTRRSLRIREDSLRLVTLRVERGVAAEIDQRQAETLVKTARATRVTLERLQAQKENQIRLLLGENPGPIDRGQTLLEQKVAIALPAGLPSELLERRPDIRAAEQRLMATNFQIGVARAAFFPRIGLTAQAGFESAALMDLLGGSNITWAFGPALSLPIFNGGRLRSNLRGAKARQQIALLQYQQTVQQAFRDAADSLIGYRKLAEFRAEQESLAESLAGAVSISYLRYSNGVTSYLEFPVRREKALVHSG